MPSLTLQKFTVSKILITTSQIENAFTTFTWHSQFFLLKHWWPLEMLAQSTKHWDDQSTPHWHNHGKTEFEVTTSRLTLTTARGHSIVQIRFGGFFWRWFLHRFFNFVFVFFPFWAVGSSLIGSVPTCTFILLAHKRAGNYSRKIQMWKLVVHVIRLTLDKAFITIQPGRSGLVSYVITYQLMEKAKCRKFFVQTRLSSVTLPFVIECHQFVVNLLNVWIATIVWHHAFLWISEARWKPKVSPYSQQLSRQPWPQSHL